MSVPLTYSLTHTHQLLISRLIAFISSGPVIYWFGKIVMDRELAILETAPMLIQTSFKGIDVPHSYSWNNP